MCSFQSIAQVEQNSTISAKEFKDPIAIVPVFHYGKIWKHTVNFKPSINGPSVAFELDFEKQTCGTKYWQQVYHYPCYGLALGFIRFNNDSVLGKAISILPYVHIPVLSFGKKEEFRMFLRFGSGLAYLNKHYDVITNPGNNVIACGLNNITSIGLRINIKATERSLIVLGAGLTHYSTGDARLPNLGINVPDYNIGFKYFISRSINLYHQKVIADTVCKKIIFRNKFTIARFEASLPNGPLYSQMGIEMAAGKYLATWNKLFINVDGFYNSFNYYFALNQELNVGKQFQHALGSTLMLEDEFVFGKAGIAVALGSTLNKDFFSGTAYFEKVGILYHFLHFSKSKPRNLFTGVFLKTHWANAEHVEVFVGIEW